MVAWPILAQQHRPSACGDVEHRRSALVPKIDQVAGAIATADEHGVDVGVGGHHIFGYLEGTDRGAAAHVQVNAPGPRGTDLVSQINACRPLNVLFPFLGGTQHHVDLLRRDVAFGKAVLSRPDGRLIRVIVRISLLYLYLICLVHNGANRYIVIRSPGIGKSRLFAPKSGIWQSPRSKTTIDSFPPWCTR